MRAALLVLACACAPVVDGPVEKQRAIDRADGDRLALQIGALPGVVRADVMLRRAVRDPLATTAPTTPVSSAIVIVDDRADRSKIEQRAQQLAHAIAPEIEPTVIVEVGATRAELAKVGPFTVEASSKNRLKAVLAVALAIIAALAGWIAYVSRRVA
jgi:hypothetical protein